MKNIYKSLSIAFFLLLSNALFGSIEIETPDCVCLGSTISLSISIEADEGFELAEPFAFHWEGPGGYISYSQNPVNIQSPGTYTVTVTNAYGCETILSTEVVQCNQNNPLEIQVNSMPTCYDDSSGSASVEASGGESPYTYLWDDGSESTESEITDLAPGMYCVTVTDAQGCEVEDCVEVEELSAINIEFEVEASCSGASTGSIVPTVTGGEAPYRYEWSNSSHLSSLNNISEGDYGVIVTDDNGCRILADVNVPEMDSPSIRETITPADCADEDNGSISITIEDGSEPYDIYWEGPDGSEWHGITELNNLAAGDYCVTVTDANGCSETECYSTVADEPQVFMPFIEQVMVTAVVNGGESTLLYDGYWQQIANGMYCFQGGMVNFEGNEDELERLLDAMERGLVVLEVLAYIQGDVSGDIFLDVEGVYYERGTVNLGEVTWGIDVFSTSQLAANNLDAMMTFTHPELLDLFHSSNVYDDCVEIPGLMPDCSWAPNHPQGQDIHSLYLGCTEITFDINYDNDYIYANVLGNASDYRFAWVNSNGQQLGSDQRFYPPADGEYCLIVTNQNTGCRKRECVDFCGGFDEFVAEESYVEYINPCEGMFNGSICIDDEEGDYNFSIEWRNGSNDLCLEDIGAGEYCAVITEHDCEIEVYHCFNLEVVEDISAEITEAIPSCRGRSNGELCVTASGGEPPYYYRWQDGQVGNCITNIAAGEYCVYIKDACGAEYRDCFELGEITELGFTEININPTCVDADEGSFEVTVKGGRPPYIYTLYDVSGNEVNNGSDTPTDFQQLAQGIYTIEVEDDCGNTIEQDVEITEISEEEGGISASIVDIDAPSCGNDNGSITISASSRGGYYPISYSLFVGGSVVEMGEITNSDEFTISNIEFGVAYTIILTNDIGCTWKTNYQSDVPDSAEDDFEVHHEYSCAPEEGSIQNFISNDHEHEWNFTWSNGSNEPELYHLEAGEYCVTISNSETGECKEACFLVKYIDEPEEIEDNYFTISPEYTCEPGEGSIENALAEAYQDDWAYSWSNGSSEYEISDLEAGIYCLTMTNVHDNSCRTGCFIVESVNTDPEVLSSTIENVNCALSCEGSIDIEVNAPDYMEYSWSTGSTFQDVSNLCSGEYSVTVSSGECSEVYSYDVELDEPDFDYDVEIAWHFNNERISGGAAQVFVISEQFITDGVFVLSSSPNMSPEILTSYPNENGRCSLNIPLIYQNVETFYFTFTAEDGCIYTGEVTGLTSCEYPDHFNFEVNHIGEETACGSGQENTYVINIDWETVNTNNPYYLLVTMTDAWDEGETGYTQLLELTPGQDQIAVYGIPSGKVQFVVKNHCSSDVLAIKWHTNCCFNLQNCDVISEGESSYYDGSYYYNLPYFTIWAWEICTFDPHWFPGVDHVRSKIFIEYDDDVASNCWTGFIEIIYPDGSKGVLEVREYNDTYESIVWVSGEQEWFPEQAGNYPIKINYIGSGDSEGVDCENEVLVDFYGGTHYNDAVIFKSGYPLARPFEVPDYFFNSYYSSLSCGTCASEEGFVFDGNLYYIDDFSECTETQNYPTTYFDFTPNDIDDPCNSGGKLKMIAFNDVGNPVSIEYTIPAPQDGEQIAIDQHLGGHPHGVPDCNVCTDTWWCLFDALDIYGFPLDKPILATGYDEDSCTEVIIDDEESDCNGGNGVGSGGGSGSTPCDDANLCPDGYTCESGECVEDELDDIDEEDVFIEGCSSMNLGHHEGRKRFNINHSFSGHTIEIRYNTAGYRTRVKITGGGIDDEISCSDNEGVSGIQSRTYSVTSNSTIHILFDPCEASPRNEYNCTIICDDDFQEGQPQALVINNSGFIEQENKVLVHPNPFESNVDIIISEVETPFEGEIVLFNYYGDAVVRNKRRIEKGNNSINVEGLDELAGGMYILLLKKDGEIYASKKVVKME